MELALCYTCFMAKWRIHSKFLSDIPPEAQGELCVQCRGAVAIVRVMGQSFEPLAADTPAGSSSSVCGLEVRSNLSKR